MQSMASEVVRLPSESRNLQAHQFYPPANAGHAFASVTDRANSTCHVRAMAVVVSAFAAVLNAIVAVDIIDNTITIIVDTVVRNLCGIYPNVRSQILVCSTN